MNGRIAGSPGIAAGAEPAGRRPLRILTFSTLYPNAAQSHHGVFVENRLRHLLAGGGIEARVVAPVPWFPSRHPVFGSYGVFARVPGRERRHGIDIFHPRYPVIPKIGMTAAPGLLYAWTRRCVTRLQRDGFDFDLIDAHYFYPDGVAAVLLARALDKPVVITARGTDINRIPAHPAARRMIAWAARRADAMVAVCRALKDEMVTLGLPEAAIRVLRNGVDLDLFRPSPDEAATWHRELDLSSPVLLSVGALIPRKGHDLVIRALRHLPAAHLMIVGAGAQDGRLRRLAAEEGVAERVHFLGPRPHDTLPGIYSAADVLVLASDREGWPNVLLEAMACGTPVAATAVWGNPEVVAAPAAGRLIPERSPEAIARTVASLLADPPGRAATRRYAEGFGWDDTSRGQRILFREVLERRGLIFGNRNTDPLISNLE
ncbi:MAG: glycosyltransferase family 4 protein [Alphaproteobacteria bacterium]|nr:MAG: glycosyltransferase family 4 protein [Alphaproteobacteria bacterium]